MRPRSIRSARSLCALILSTALLAGAPHAAQAAPGGIEPAQDCQAQAEALDLDRQRVDRHNATPHVFPPSQRARFDAYNAEAAQIRAKVRADIGALDACRRAVRALEHGKPLPKPKAATLDSIRKALDRIPGSYTAPSRTPRDKNGNARVVPELKPLHEALRGITPTGVRPTDLLQGKPQPAVGDRDPSVASGGPPIGSKPGRPDEPAVAADHIITLAEMLYLPGFVRLPPEYIYKMANSPLNLQWMSQSAVTMANFDPQWRKEQTALEDAIRSRLTDLIDEIRKGLGG